MRRRGDLPPTPSDDESFEDDEPAAKPPESPAAQTARLQTEIADHGREWRSVVRGSGAPPARAFQLAELMAVKQAMIEQLQPEVDVQVTRPVRGRSYTVGEREFPPGHYRVKAGVAEMLRWLMDQDRIMEERRMRTLDEQRQLDPYGLRGLLDPSTQIDRPLGTLQG